MYSSINGFSVSQWQETKRLLLATVILISPFIADAQGHDGPHGSGAKRQASPMDLHGSGGTARNGRRPDRHASGAPHGGQVSVTRRHHFEVVYTPQETRIYIYSLSDQPIDARGVRGEVVMQLKRQVQLFRYPVKPMIDESNVAYLSVAVDVSRVPDGSMQVAFDLSDLPIRQEPNVRFSQAFALTRRPASVEVVKLTEADRPYIARQGVCPVMDVKLGDHGTPIKLVVNGQPLYVCCKGCIDKVQMNPETYLGKLAGPKSASRPAQGQPRVVVAKTTSADQSKISAQRLCPVMDQRLGGHGTPIKLLVDGRPLFVCCRGCIKKVERSPDHYVRKAAGTLR